MINVFDSGTGNGVRSRGSRKSRGTVSSRSANPRHWMISGITTDPIDPDSVSMMEGLEMTLRRIVALLALFSLVSTSIGGYLYYRSAKDAAVREAEGELGARTKLLADRVARLISANQMEVRALARFEELQDALLKTNSETVSQADRILDHFAAGLGDDVCYILDKSGKAIASSNRNKSDSFVGRDYSFRPYFREAFEGKPTTYLALGATSGVRGIYFSYPVYQVGQSRPVGVAVVKAPIEALEREFSRIQGGISLLVHKTGIIFVSSEPEWLFHFLWQSTPEQESRIAESKQFGDGPWNWTGLGIKRGNQVADRSGETYVMQEMDVGNCPGWKVVYLYDLKSMSRKLVNPLVGTAGYVALVLVSFVFIAVVLMYRTAEEGIRRRKQAEEALAESEKKYRELYENLRDGFAAVSPEGKITEFNPAFAEMLGYEAEELYRLTYEDITPKRWHVMEAEIIRTQVFERGYSDVYEKEYVRKDRTILPVEVRTHLIPDGRGGHEGMWAFVRDISERKRVEAVARNEKLRFETLAENAPFGLVMISEKGLFQYINPRFKEMFGYDAKDVPSGRDWFRRAYPDPTERRTVIRTWLEDARNAGPAQPRPRTFKVTCKDGTQKTVNFVPVHLATGQHLMACEDVTERKKLEAERELLFKLSMDMLCVAGFDGFFKQVNPAWTRTLGWTTEELLSRPWMEFVHPDDLDKTALTGSKLMAGESIYGFENRYACKDGSYRWISWNSFPLTGEDLIFAVARDTTDRKKAELALEENRGRLRSVLDHLPDMLWMKDLEGHFLLVNDAFAGACGRNSVEEVIGKTDFEIWPEDLARRYAADDKEVIRERKSKLVEEPIIDRGVTKWFETFKTPLYGSQHEVMGTVGSARDITDRKTAEQALRQSEEKYRKILETIADGYHEVDLKGNLTLVNDSLCEILGYSRDELLGKSYRELMDVENAERIFGAYNAVFRSGIANPEFSYQVRRKDGAVRDISVSIALMGDGAGTTTGFRGIFRDITERRLLEEQLRQAVKMEAIGRLAGGIAHDFNNLLTAIMGYTTMLTLEMREEEPARRRLDQINRAATRASDLTRQLLAFSRKQVLEVSVVNLNDLVRDIESMLKRLLGEDVELITELGQDIGNVRADQPQLEQVAVNLAVNARDAMPTGGTLTLETLNAVLDESYCASHTEVKPGEYVLLCVSDTGHGMTPETCARAFDPFFTTKPTGAGTGLGLSTVYGIVKQHGGHVAVYSEAGRGTTFKIYLPRVNEPLTTQQIDEQTLERPHGTETILLVEDEETVRDLAAEALEMLGYSLLKAASPAEAVGISTDHAGPIDLLLTDVVLPQMDGKTLYESLVKSRSEMKVLYVSGYTENFIVHRGILDPKVSFLQKPFTLDSIARKVRRVLDED
jgi:two-component system, cell cycle sensor histidine kinase and response regulator CckA